jgi:hypothetical protein
MDQSRSLPVKQILDRPISFPPDIQTKMLFALNVLRLLPSDSMIKTKILIENRVEDPPSRIKENVEETITDRLELH